MTRLRIACLLVAVVAGDYGALSLLQGETVQFVLAAAICAASSVAAGLIAFADDEHARRQHELNRRGRAAVTRREHLFQQPGTAGGQRAPLFDDLHQKRSDSAGLADRQDARSPGAYAPNGYLGSEHPLWLVASGNATRHRGRLRRRRVSDDPGMEALA
jgi:hypothetical protein